MYSRCEEVQDDFSALLDDELSPEEREAFEAHLSQCSDCLRKLDQLKQVDRLFRGLPAVTAPVGFEASIRESLRPGIIRFPRLAIPGRLHGALFAVAAVALICLSIGVMYVRVKTDRIQLARAPEAAVAAEGFEVGAAEPEQQESFADTQEGADKLGSTPQAEYYHLGVTTEGVVGQSARPANETESAGTVAESLPDQRAAAVAPPDSAARADLPDDQATPSVVGAPPRTAPPAFRDSQAVGADGFVGEQRSRNSVESPEHLRASATKSNEHENIFEGPQSEDEVDLSPLLESLAEPEGEPAPKIAMDRSAPAVAVGETTVEADKIGGGGGFGGRGMPFGENTAQPGKELALNLRRETPAESAQAERVPGQAPAAAPPQTVPMRKRADTDAVTATQTLANTRVFTEKDGALVEEGYNGEPVIELARDSQILRDLTAKDADVAKFITWEKRVIFRTGGVWYAIPEVPSGSQSP